jgi:hypothetical protein
MADNMTTEPTEPSESVSQEITGVIDTGAESFTVDKTPAPVEGKTGGLPAKETLGEELEKKPGETPKEPTGETPKESVEEKPGEKPTDDEELPKGIKKRLATITRKRYDAERETAVLRAQNEELLARINAPEHPEAKTNEEPAIDDFDTEEEYLEAVSEFRADQKVAQRDADQEAAQAEKIREGQEAEASARQEVFRDKLQGGVEKYGDFEEVVSDLNITGDMINILESFSNIPEVVYELGTKPELVKELIGMPFLDAAYKMKEISDNLVKKKSTKAPDPIKPVSTTGGTIKNLEQMSQAEYNAYRDKQDAERRGMNY